MKKVGHYSVKTRGKPPIYDHDKIKKLLSEGKKNPAIVEEIGCTYGYLCNLKNKWEFEKKRRARA